MKMNKPFNLKEYEDFKYQISKEYYYYLHTYNKDKETMNKLDFYRKIQNNINNFERLIITEALNKNAITAEYFKIGID